MLIGIFGENCVGKSTLAEALRDKLGGEIMVGKDYLRLAKNDSIAEKLFVKKLNAAVTGETLIYVISEKSQLLLLPGGAVRVLVTAELDTILSRFTARLHGSLPAPVKAMLERNHGCFDGEPCHIHAVSENMDTEAVYRQICGGIQ